MGSQGSSSVSDLTGIIRPRYAKEVQNLIADEAIVQKDFPLSQAERVGQLFAVPVVVKKEWGVTFLGSGGDVGSLNSPLNGVIAQAQVTPFEMNTRGYISYAALVRGDSASNNLNVSSSAIMKMQQLRLTHTSVHEMSLLHGQEGIATVSSFGTATVTITAGSWSTGIASTLVGATIDIYQSDLATPRTNATSLTVSSVDFDARTITFSAITGTPVAGDVLFIKGSNSSGTFNECPGMGKILKNTGSLFNIDAATYPVWKGNVDSTSGLISMGKLFSALAKAQARGGSGKWLAYVSPAAFAVLNSDETAKRVFMDGSNADKSGFGSMLFTSGNGTLEVKAHPYQKDGVVYLVHKDTFKRIGSSEPTMELPGTNQELIRFVTGFNAYEFQVFSDVCGFFQAPGFSVVLSAVTLS